MGILVIPQAKSAKKPISAKDALFLVAIASVSAMVVYILMTVLLG